MRAHRPLVAAIAEPPVDPREAAIGWNRKDKVQGSKLPEELRARLPGLGSWTLAPAEDATEASLRAGSDGRFRIEGALPWSQRPWEIEARATEVQFHGRREK